MHSEIKEVTTKNGEGNCEEVKGQAVKPEAAAATKIQSLYRGLQSLYFFFRQSAVKTDHKNKLQNVLTEFKTKRPTKFKYITWDEFKKPGNITGLEYQKSYDELLCAYKEGRSEPESSAKDKSKDKKASQRKSESSAKDKSEDKASQRKFYKQTGEAVDKFLSSIILKDLFDGYKNNSSLTYGQKEDVEKIVKALGARYQLEINTLITSCAGADGKYDTHFYHNPLGSSLESIVAKKNKQHAAVDGRNPFEIREGNYNANSSALSSLAIAAFKKNKALDVGSEEVYEISIFAGVVEGSTALAFGALCKKIIGGAVSANQGDMNLTRKPVANHNRFVKNYSTNFEGRKVIVPISVKSTRANADGYNTEDGIKALLQVLDSRLDELTLVRCDTAHIWTELQVAILTKAAGCTNKQEFDSYISELFLKDEKDGSFVMDEATGFYELKKESPAYTDIYNKTVADGEEWERKFFCPMYDVLSQHHFKDAAYIHAGLTDKYEALHASKDGDVTKKFEKQFVYKSSYEQELEEINKIKGYYGKKLRRLIVRWVLEAAGFSAAQLKAAGFSAADLKAAGFSAAELKNAGFSAVELKNADGQDDEKEEAYKKLANLSLVMSLVDTKIFEEVVKKIDAEEQTKKLGKNRYRFSKDTLKDIYEKASNEFVKVLGDGDNKDIKDDLYSLVDQILEDKKPNLYQNLDEEFILQMVYASMYAEEHHKAPEQFQLDFANIQLYCSQAAKQNTADYNASGEKSIAEEDSVKVAQPKIGVISMFPPAPSTSGAKDNAERVGPEQAALNR